jgi:hypothetical protein
MRSCVEEGVVTVYWCKMELRRCLVSDKKATQDSFVDLSFIEILPVAWKTQAQANFKSEDSHQSTQY